MTNTSGIAGVGYWINQYLKTKGMEKVDKNSPLVQSVYAWVQAQYDAGRVTMISDDELREQTEKALNEG